MLNLDIDLFQDSTEVLPILWMFKCGSQLGVRQVCANFCLNCLFLIIMVPIFSVGKIIYWVGNFRQWAGLIYWVGKLIY